MEQDELITSFFNLTGCYDLDVANKYLAENNWNLSAAYAMYEQSKETPAPIVNDPVDIDIPQEPSITDYIKGAFSWIFPPKVKIAEPSTRPRAQVPKEKRQVESFQTYLQQLFPPNSPKIGNFTIDTIAQASERANKLALVYIHQLEYGDVFVRTVLCNSDIISIINSGFIFLGILANSNEGSEAIARLSDEVNAVFVILNSNQVVDRIEYLPSIDELLEFLLKYSSGPEEVFDEDRYIRKEQERELKEAEIQMEQQKEAEKRRKAEEAQERQEKLLIAQKVEAEREEKRKIVGNEPEPGEGTTQITFRMPGGEKVERRFLAESKVELLYLFLESLNIGKCEMLTGFPPKVLNSGTLQDEGLVPRGLIHVRLGG